MWTSKQTTRSAPLVIATVAASVVIACATAQPDPITSAELDDGRAPSPASAAQRMQERDDAVVVAADAPIVKRRADAILRVMGDYLKSADAYSA